MSFYYKKSSAKVKPFLANQVPEEPQYTPVRFYDAVRPVFIFAQIFSIMPVNGFLSRSIHGLNFRWISIRTFYSFYMILGIFVFNVLTIYWLFSTKMNFQKATRLAFYVSNLYALCCFVYIARKWPKVMKFWVEVEDGLPKVSTKWEKIRLNWKIRLTSIIILLTSVIEHILYIVKGINLANKCSKLKNPIEAYYRKAAPQVFTLFTYNDLKGVLASFFLISSTFIWNYMDLFIMVIGFGLSEKFEQINKRLLMSKGKPMSLDYYLEFRIHYRNVANLCEMMDDTICPITLVSFSNNFFFICIQLINIMDPFTSTFHAVYFWYSLIYLIIKSFIVSVNCAKINEKSKEPLDVIRSVPRESWHPELKRFLEDIKNNEIGLTGMKFFYITKRLILAVAGTILTYDLVLIQFHEFDPTENDPCFN